MFDHECDNAAQLTKTFMEAEPHLRAQLARFLNREEDIEDILYEAYAKAYDAMQKQSIHAPKEFLMRITRNLAINQLNKHSNRFEEAKDPYELNDEHGYEGNSEATLINEEKLAVLESAIDKLPQQCQKAFILRSKNHLSYKEIAITMGISVKTVERHLSEAVKKCAQSVKQEWHQNKNQTVTAIDGSNNHF